jgi:hypothetical protein
MSVSVSLIVLRLCPTVDGKWRRRLRLDSTISALTILSRIVATPCPGPGWSRQGRCTARHTEGTCTRTKATQRCDSRSCQNNTPLAVRCRSTGKNVPTATAAATPIISITHRGRCDAGAPEKCTNSYSGGGSRLRARDVAHRGLGPTARPAVGSIEVPPGSLAVPKPTDPRSWSPHHPTGRSPHARPPTALAG